MDYMIEIKNLPITRWKEYKNLRLEALKSDPLAFGSSYPEEKKLKEEEWKRRIVNTVFALSNDKLIGMVGYVFRKRTKLKHVADIFGVYVNNKYRGQGIGRELLKAAISTISKNKKIIKIELSANTEQKAAIKLYEKNGFTIAGKLTKEFKVNGKFFDEVIMEKLI